MWAWIRECLMDIKMFSRGFKRIAPRGMRGRVYAPRHPAPPAPEGDTMAAPAQGTAVLKARVYREATGEWEDLGEIAHGNVPNPEAKRLPRQ